MVLNVLGILIAECMSDEAVPWLQCALLLLDQSSKLRIPPGGILPILSLNW